MPHFIEYRVSDSFDIYLYRFQKIIGVYYNIINCYFSILLILLTIIKSVLPISILILNFALGWILFSFGPSIGFIYIADFIDLGFFLLCKLIFWSLVPWNIYFSYFFCCLYSLIDSFMVFLYPNNFWLKARWAIIQYSVSLPFTLEFVDYSWNLTYCPICLFYYLIFWHSCISCLVCLA